MSNCARFWCSKLWLEKDDGWVGAAQFLYPEMWYKLGLKNLSCGASHIYEGRKRGRAFWQLPFDYTIPGEEGEKDRLTDRLFARGCKARKGGMQEIGSPKLFPIFSISLPCDLLSYNHFSAHVFSDITYFCDLNNIFDSNGVWSSWACFSHVVSAAQERRLT